MKITLLSISDVFEHLRTSDWVVIMVILALTFVAASVETDESVHTFSYRKAQNRCNQL